ncbi:MarR family winged helix-turn-helix transcriptional regulator [Cellulomonas sp. P22]|uniref:MarR family winged helix-turn-helix transcriptional regulator n=1 Tax=Cellulomonas sp. P22 TaxID=3373189 RepID=UPI0037875066
MEESARDGVDRMQAAWNQVRPELDTVPMGVVGRLLRAAPLVLASCEAYLAPHDLSRAEFDIVSALTRSGRPLSPGELSRELLFTGPATTKRLRRLEDGGWIVRDVNPEDARGFLIAPTPDGARRFDALLPGYLAHEASLIAMLDADQQEQVGDLLRTLLGSWERSTSDPQRRAPGS